MNWNPLCIKQLFGFLKTSSLATLILVSMTPALWAQQIDVWVGTSGDSGIFHLKLNTENGKLSKPENVAKISGAGFLAMHPNGKVLYSTAKQKGQSGIAAFVDVGGELSGFEQALAKSMKQFSAKHPEVIQLKRQVEELKKRAEEPDSEKLTFLNFMASGDGGAACVAVDKTGKVAMSAQYGGGSTSTYTLNQDGSIATLVATIDHGDGSGVHKKRQSQPHPHWVGTSPDNKFLMVPDLGKDAVVVYQLDLATGKATKHQEIATPPGSGPRHMKFHTTGKYAYVLNELALTVSVFAYEPESAKFSELQVIRTLAKDLKDKHLNSAAEIRVHPTGKFIYTSNRGHDSITVFSVDQSTGKLTFVENEHIRGAWPRNFCLDPSGKWLIAAGQHSNTLAVFEVDPESGKLTYARQNVNIPRPICVLFGSE